MFSAVKRVQNSDLNSRQYCVLYVWKKLASNKALFTLFNKFALLKLIFRFKNNFRIKA